MRVRPVLEQLAQHGGRCGLVLRVLAQRRGQVQRRVAVAVLGGAAAALQQQPHALRVACVCG